MLTTINFNVTSNCQKKLLCEGKDAKRNQTIELDITSEVLINRANMSNDGKASITIDYYNHYDDQDYYRSYYKEFETIPTEIDLMHFFEEEELKKQKDEIIEKQKRAERAEKERLEKIEDEKAEKLKEEENNRKAAEKERINEMIDAFVDESGSQTSKLRKELGFKYFDLAINELIDQIEPQGKITEECDVSYIDKPSFELMQKIKAVKASFDGTILDDVIIQPVIMETCDGYELERFEGLEIDYYLCGETKTRLYQV
jgi:hypothetical protein